MAMRLMLAAGLALSGVACGSGFAPPVKNAQQANPADQPTSSGGDSDVLRQGDPGTRTAAGDPGSSVGGDSNVSGSRLPQPGGDPGPATLVGGDSGGTTSGTTINPLWDCNPDWYSDSSCDCGCGAIDPACGSGGCAAPGCSDPACDYCIDATGAVTACGSGSSGSGSSGSGSTTTPPASWTCNPSYYSDSSCDCGCGAPDPACGTGGCTTPGCDASACAFCWDPSGAAATCGSGGSSSGGTGTTPPASWTCPASWWGDGMCDCGCGAVDVDCGTTAAVCTAPGACGEAACDDCVNASGAMIACGQWTCNTSWYGDGTCDCGCGALDPDCGSQPSCTTPGPCSASACVFCWDASGNAVSCQ